MKTAIVAVMALFLLAGCAATAPVAPTAELTQPLQQGMRAPDAAVRTARDEPTTLRAAMAGEPTVLIFYRGGWCPYCNRHLAAVAEITPQLEQMGYRVIALSADRPEKASETATARDVPFTLLSDADMHAARTYGLAFVVDDATVEKYHGYGIDLEDASGREHRQLPVPAVFIIDAGGTIRFTHADPDYRKRISNDDLLQAADDARQP